MGKSRRRAKGGGPRTKDSDDDETTILSQPLPPPPPPAPRRRQRNVTLRHDEYGGSPFLDLIAQIPLLNMIAPYVIFPILKLVIDVCQWLLDHWRTAPQAIGEFRALAPRRMFHLHVFFCDNHRNNPTLCFAWGWMWQQEKLYFVSRPKPVPMEEN